MTSSTTKREGLVQKNPVGEPEKLTAVVQDQIRSRLAKFTVLIGSRARRTQNAFSDIDLVRIGHKEPMKLKNGRKQELSYIDYEIERFLELYERGSLFLYHVFKEGQLLEGSAVAWQWLKDHFEVRTDFREEISRNRQFLRWLQKGAKYKGAVMPYLAHTCRALKNLAIFSLAEKRKYVFDKRGALQAAFPRLPGATISLLVEASNSFERQPWRPLAGAAINPTAIRRLNRQIASAVNLPEVDAAG